nr:indolepyruvate ferredoxin oxidoreductase family protein [Pseudomonas sp.]
AAVARNAFKLMAYKDEYEVARLYTDGVFLDKIASRFEGDYKLQFHLAPPLTASRDNQGHLIKRAYGPWMLKAFKMLAAMRFVRGTPLDPFGRTAERRAERALIDAYFDTVHRLLDKLKKSNLDLAVQIASLPEEIRGYGHIKEANMQRAQKKHDELMSTYEMNIVNISRAA